MIRLEHLCDTALITTSPAKAWRTIGDFYGLGSWYPGVVKLDRVDQGARQIRMVHSADGTHFKEELLFRHPECRTIAYQLDAGDLDVSVYVSIISVIGRVRGTSQVIWDTMFQSLPNRVYSNRSDIAEIMDDGLRSLETMFGRLEM